MSTTVLPALPVVLPLLMAALLTGVGAKVHRRLLDALALGTTATVAGVCLWLMRASAEAPLVYWFGGWEVSQGVPLGIAFVVDPLGAGMALLVAALATAALAFTWHYFESVGHLFHVLLLVFVAGMAGFSLTGDLFNLFVFFELMGVAAYALTGYKVEEVESVQGALNFGITNTAGGTLLLLGTALLYGRTGALNLAAIGQALAKGPADALVVCAFVLLTVGLLTKGAVVPFHFWLADAHAVAPSPVCALFSGVMVELGLYGLARVYWTVFSGALEAHREGLRTLLVALGVLTSVVGALMCFQQHHLKRLLAFSTISHMGMVLAGVGLLSPSGLAGAAVYVLAHAPTKAALFLSMGVVLDRLRSVDEVRLKGRGKELPWEVALAFGLGGVALAGMPPLGLFVGKAVLDAAAVEANRDGLAWVFAFVGAMTGGAVLRAAARMFLGWGGEAGGRLSEEQDEQRPESAEGGGRTPRLMRWVVLVLALAGPAVGARPLVAAALERHAAHFEDRDGSARRVLTGAAWGTPEATTAVEVTARARAFGWGGTAAAVLLALAVLKSKRAQGGARRLLRGALAPLRNLHSGHVGDYLAWWVVGAAGLGGAVFYVVVH